MSRLAIALLVLGACSNEGKLDAEARASCTALLKHIVQISPQSTGQDPDKVVAALPIEDLQGCGATEPEIRECMLAAPDVAAVKKCIPSDEVLGCMQKAAKAKAKAHEKANKKEPDPAIDQPFDAIRAKCWGGGTAGDPKAADGLKLD